MKEILSRIMNIDMKHKKSFVILTIHFLILSACGGTDDTSNETTEATEETTTTQLQMKKHLLGKFITKQI